MRFFTEDKRFFGTFFNEDEYKLLETDANKYSFTYIKTKEEPAKFKDNKKTGERKWDKPITDTIVEGYWMYAGLYSGEEIPEPPENYPKQFVYPVSADLKPSQIVEEVGIIRELTEEEKEERQREKERQEEEQRQAEEKAFQRDTYLKTSDGNVRLDVRVPNEKVEDNAAHHATFLNVNYGQTTCNIPNLADEDIDLAVVNKIYLDGRLENLKQEIIEELRNK